VHEADVRDRVQEVADVGQDPVLVRVGPELPGDLELLVDVDGLGDVDAAVGVLRRVVQLAQRRVAGAGVVPRVAALGGGGVEALDQVMDQFGSTRRSRAPRVALMIPAPISTTSVLPSVETVVSDTGSFVLH
jgi:hypothetical protein